MKSLDWVGPRCGSPGDVGGCLGDVDVNIDVQDTLMNLLIEMLIQTVNSRTR